MNQKIDGKVLSESHTQELIKKVTELKDKLGKSYREPAIVSFCNEEDPPSVKYTQMKYQKAQDIGINFKIENYHTQTDHDELSQKVKDYNQNETIDGIMVQLPLPLDLVVFKDDLLTLIEPTKDVDGLTTPGQEYFLPATVKSVISILNAEVSNWISQKIGVVGSEGEVGVPLVKELYKLGVTDLVLVDRNIGNLEMDLLKCQIVISTTGKEGLIKQDYLNDGFVAIDVGLGDFTKEANLKALKYTGKFGGVGPMTVVSLMENVIESFERRVYSDGTNG